MSYCTKLFIYVILVTIKVSAGFHSDLPFQGSGMAYMETEIPLPFEQFSDFDKIPTSDVCDSPIGWQSSRSLDEQQKEILKEQSALAAKSSTLDINKLQYHGTTTVAFKNGDSIIICIDSKASIGNYVGSRTVKKIFPISSHCVATMAGGAADCAYWIRRISRVSKLLAYKFGQTLGVASVAKLLSSNLREYKGMGLSVGTMVAGFDKHVGPSLFYVDSEGSCLPGDLFCVGSGSTFAYSILDAVYKSGNGNIDDEAVQIRSDKSNSDGSGYSRLTVTTSCLSDMDFHKAVDTALWAVRHATLRDGFSGGYINVLQVNATGVHHIRRVDSRAMQLNINN